MVMNHLLKDRVVNPNPNLHFGAWSARLRLMCLPGPKKCSLRAMTPLKRHAVADRDPGGIAAAVVYIWQAPVLLQLALQLSGPQKLRQPRVGTL